MPWKCIQKLSVWLWYFRWDVVSFVKLLTPQIFWEMRKSESCNCDHLTVSSLKNKLSYEQGLQLRHKLPSALLCWSCLFNFFPCMSSLYLSLNAPHNTPSRLFSNISIFSVKSCPNSPGWVLERRKHSSSKLWCRMKDSATDEPLFLPTCAYTAYIYPRGVSQDNAVWIIVLSCSRGDKANLQFSSCGALAHEEM